LETGKYIEKRLEESQVINLIIEKTKCFLGNLDYFWHITNVPRNGDFSFDKYFITKEILRTELGFEKNKKPGDIDILIIPAKEGRIYFEYSSAFELKVVRPTNKNFRKNSTSLGSTQTFGLIQDGFPLVGLIHVCMNQPVDPKYLQYLPNLENVSEIFTHDPFPLYSIETQYQRILKTALPKYVGINIFGISFDKNGNIDTQHSAMFEKYNCGYFNPHANSVTVEKIERHFHQFRAKYVERNNNE
jgi:hypothetical protein